MDLVDYKYSGIELNDFQFNKVELKNINLLVGASGTGKTRFLNTIFNLGSMIHKKEIAWVGNWEIIFRQNNKKYKWEIITDSAERNQKKVVKDNLCIEEHGKYISLVTRDENSFVFNDSLLPKLSQNVLSVTLLKAEPTIRPIYEGFGHILKRYFAQESKFPNLDYDPLTPQLKKFIFEEKSLVSLFNIEASISIKLYFLFNLFPDVFKEIVRNYKAIFPFISEAKIFDFSELHPNLPISSEIPIFCIKEKGVDKWIGYNALSSGMQKVLLIVLDIYLIPKGGIYLIDEYENSLGVNAIDFFPDFISSLGINNQFIITSHHPYLINRIPVKNWYVFQRKGCNVTIRYGEELVNRFGKSKQQAFLQLINDPIYTGILE